MNRRNFLKSFGIGLSAFFFSLETFLGLFKRKKKWREVPYDYTNKNGIATGEVITVKDVEKAVKFARRYSPRIKPMSVKGKEYYFIACVK